MDILLTKQLDKTSLRDGNNHCRSIEYSIYHQSLEL